MNSFDDKINSIRYQSMNYGPIEINYERTGFNIHLLRLFKWKLIFDDDLALRHAIDHSIVADRHVHYGLIDYVRDPVDYIISEIALQAGELGLETLTILKQNSVFGSFNSEKKRIL